MFFIGFRAETFGEKSIGPKMWKKFYSKIIAMILKISKSISVKTLKSSLTSIDKAKVMMAQLI